MKYNWLQQKGHYLWTHAQASGLSALMLMGAVVCCLFVVNWEQLVNVGADRLVNVGADRLVNFGAEWHNLSVYNQ